LDNNQLEQGFPFLEMGVAYVLLMLFAYIFEVKLTTHLQEG